MVHSTLNSTDFGMKILGLTHMLRVGANYLRHDYSNSERAYNKEGGFMKADHFAANGGLWYELLDY